MFYVLMNHEQSAASADTLDEARSKGQAICDAEILPASFAIYEEETFIEMIERTDGKSLGQQISHFIRLVSKP